MEVQPTHVPLPTDRLDYGEVDPLELQFIINEITSNSLEQQWPFVLSPGCPNSLFFCLSLLHFHCVDRFKDIKNKIRTQTEMMPTTVDHILSLFSSLYEVNVNRIQVTKTTNSGQAVFAAETKSFVSADATSKITIVQTTFNNFIPVVSEGASHRVDPDTNVKMLGNNIAGIKKGLDDMMESAQKNAVDSDIVNYLTTKLVPRWQRELSKLEEALPQLQQPVEVTIIGETGVGKSTLINALLGCDVMPVSRFNVGTASAIQVKGSHKSTYGITISLLTEQELAKDIVNYFETERQLDKLKERLRRKSTSSTKRKHLLEQQTSCQGKLNALKGRMTALFGDALPAVKCLLKKSKNSKRNKLVDGVHPFNADSSSLVSMSEDNNSSSSNNNSYINKNNHNKNSNTATTATTSTTTATTNNSNNHQSNSAASLKRKTVGATEKQKAEAASKWNQICSHLVKKTLQFDYSEVGDVQQALSRYALSEPQTGFAWWPLVKNVTVTGPFKLLKDGVRIVDLPGLNDRNPAREEITLKYLQNCHYVIMAIGTDRVFKKSEQKIFHMLHAQGLTRKMIVVATKLQQKAASLEELMLLGTQARKVSRNALREMLTTMDEEDEATDISISNEEMVDMIPVVPVDSAEFLHLSRSNAANPLFLEALGIPSVRRVLLEHANTRIFRLNQAMQTFTAMVQTFLNIFDASNSGGSRNPKHLEIINRQLSELGKQLTASKDSQLDNLQQIRKAVLREVGAQCDLVYDLMDSKLDRWSMKLACNTFKATMRRFGRFHKNMNTSFTAMMLQHAVVRKHVDSFFQESLREMAAQFVEVVVQAAQQCNDKICTDCDDGSSVVVPFSSSLLKACLNEKLNEATDIGSQRHKEIWTHVEKATRKYLSSYYTRAAGKRGNNCYEKMLEVMKEGIQGLGGTQLHEMKSRLGRAIAELDRLLQGILELSVSHLNNHFEQLPDFCAAFLKHPALVHFQELLNKCLSHSPDAADLTDLNEQLNNTDMFDVDQADLLDIHIDAENYSDNSFFSDNDDDEEDDDT